MNEDVLDMIDTLHARLKDVQEVVEGLDCEAVGYATRLDKIDDEVYALQLDLERLGCGEAVAADDAQPVAKATSDAGAEGEREILSDEMKENLKGAGRTAAEVLRDGKEVVSELTSTMNEFKDAFSLKPTKK